MNTLQSIDARTGNAVGAPWPASTPDQIDAAVHAAAQAAETYANTTPAERANVLIRLAAALEAQKETLVPIADRESGLGTARLNGEVDRTAFQLRSFADALLSRRTPTTLSEAAIDLPPPAGRPQLTRTQVPLGPVAVFSASNFPFAFSVLGGDTASALAAGCPVIVKAHPSHPELSRRVVDIAKRVVADCHLPAGVFNAIEGASAQTGAQLVQSAAIEAVAFTGSLQGGMALARLAYQRPKPIPFYGELGSVNPVIVRSEAVRQNGLALANALADSICAGAGQFCTSPGIVVVEKGAEGDAFVANIAQRLEAASLHVMLNDGIKVNFNRGVTAWSQQPDVKTLVNRQEDGSRLPGPFLAEIDADAFLAHHALHEEVFGSAALIVRVNSEDQTLQILQAIAGSLTVTLWGVDEDTASNRRLISKAMQIAGRVLFKGVPTGVAVTAAQQHGGPFPASTSALHTSVGLSAIERFLRPVALQDAPAWLGQGICDQ